MFNIYISRYQNDLGQFVQAEKLLMSIPYLNGTPPINNPVVNTSWDTIGSFDFEVEPTSPYFNAFLHMKTILRVQYDGTTIFYGRVLAIQNSFTGNRKIKCEDCYGFFNDVYIKGEEDKKRKKQSLNDYITETINAYNDQAEAHKRFTIGEIPGAYSRSTVTAKQVDEVTRKHGKAGWSSVKSILDDLASHYGGHWRARYDDASGQLKIDWFKNYFRTREEIAADTGNTHVMGAVTGTPSNSGISMVARSKGTGVIDNSDASSDAEMSNALVVTRNVIDLNHSLEIDNIFTRVIPVGSSKKGTPISINGSVPPKKSSAWNKNYISVGDLVSQGFCTAEELSIGYHKVSDFQNAEDRYGIIYKVVDFPNADTTSELWEYVIDWIKNNYLGAVPNFSIKAVDMHVLNESPIKHLVGDIAYVAYPVDIDGTYNAKWMTIKNLVYVLYNPEDWQYTIGYPSETTDHEYGERPTQGNSTPSSGPSSTTQPDSNPQFTAHANIQQSVNMEYGVLAALSYQSIQAKKYVPRNAPNPGYYYYVLGLFTHEGQKYAVATDYRGLYTFKYSSTLAFAMAPTPHKFFSQTASGATSFVVDGFGFNPESLSSAADAGTVTIDVNEATGNAATMTAVGGDEVPTQTAADDGTTSSLPAGSTTANDAPAVVINDTVSYVDNEGNTQTQSGFITVQDIQLNDIPSFKTDYAKIRKLVVDELEAQNAYINNLRSNTIYADTRVTAYNGRFTHIQVSNLEGADERSYLNVRHLKLDDSTITVGSVSFNPANAVYDLMIDGDALKRKRFNESKWVTVGTFNGATSLRGVWSSADSSANLNKFTVSADKGKITPIEIRLYNHFGTYAGQDPQGNPTGDFASGFKMVGTRGNRIFSAYYEVYGNPTDDRISPTGRRAYIQDLMQMTASGFIVNGATMPVNPYAQGLADVMVTGKWHSETEGGYKNTFTATTLIGDQEGNESFSTTVNARFGYYEDAENEEGWQSAWNITPVSGQSNAHYCTGMLEVYSGEDTLYRLAVLCNDNPSEVNNPYKQGLADGYNRGLSAATVTITGVWNGDAMSFTATPSVNGSNSYSITPNVIFEGNGSTNFSAGIQAFDATIHGKKYLNLTPTYNKRNSKIDVIPVGGSVIASISIGDLYYTGLTDANVSGYWAGQKFTYQNANNASKKGIITITSEVRSVNSGEYAQINAACTGSAIPSGGIIWTKYVYLELDVENKLVKAKIGDDRTSAVSPTSISVQDVYDAGVASAPQKGIGAVSWAGDGTATIGLSSSGVSSRSISLTADSPVWGKYNSSHAWESDSNGNVAKRVIKDANASNATAYTAYVDATSRYNNGWDAAIGSLSLTKSTTSYSPLPYGGSITIKMMSGDTQLDSVTITSKANNFTTGQNSVSVWWGYYSGKTKKVNQWNDKTMDVYMVKTPESGKAADATETKIGSISAASIYTDGKAEGASEVDFDSVTPTTVAKTSSGQYDGKAVVSLTNGKTKTVTMSIQGVSTSTYTGSDGKTHRGVKLLCGGKLVAQVSLDTLWNNAGKTGYIYRVYKDGDDSKTDLGTSITANGTYKIEPGYTDAVGNNTPREGNRRTLNVTVSKGTERSNAVWGLQYYTGLDGQGQSNGTTKQTTLYYWDPNRTKYIKMDTGYWYMRSTYIQPQKAYT